MVTCTKTCYIPADSAWLVGGQKLIQMSIKSSWQHFQGLKEMWFLLVWFPYTNGILAHFCKVNEIISLFWSFNFSNIFSTGGSYKNKLYAWKFMELPFPGLRPGVFPLVFNICVVDKVKNYLTNLQKVYVDILSE